MTSPILVTGGTGTLGRLVVRRLRDAGHPVRVLSRRAREAADGVTFLTGDLVRGEGIEPALAGVTAIVHCASDKKGDDVATGNLVRAAQAQAVPPHLVYPSIVGVDAVSFGYFQSKRECERIVSESGLPWTMLRVTQFYDLVYRGTRKLARLPVIPVPAGFRCQPIDPADVATRLVELALGAPAGRVPDLGGPDVTSWEDLTRRYLRATNRRRAILPLWMPGLGKIKAGGLLVGDQPDGGIPAGRRTWEDFLSERLNEQPAN
ncbi:MAG TPA: SDR family oxidoreductase [Actinophytocola sp.]|uniref:SDR family oxidoreductase n=1 Tax=Actinophytocola sp. TaxID=1872138 RepID=UPI002DDCB993|nr:SDR family oxidoreductase [Actinophytocola sp.]HEV2780557.1 SDR family oxidoreductase [Actinophytocola sp.]